MRKYLKKLYSAHDNLEGIIGTVEAELSKYLQFEDYSVFYQPSDGFVLEHEAKNAPLSSCISVIEKKGVLSYEDYIDLCI